MPGPIEATGATRNPTRYGALTMGARQMTGMDTQRSPYRDAMTSYLNAKFYGGSRFDSIIDGINREITVNMTDKRSSGSVVFNSNTFPACNSYYAWKYIQSAQEVIRTIYDGKDGVIYDATPGQKSTLYAKAAGAGPARFLGVNTELFFGDGVETKKILRSGKVWAPDTVVNPGDFIIDSNGNIQSCQANPFSYTITDVEVVQLTGIGLTSIQILLITFSTDVPAMSSNQTAHFTGLTGYTTLNNETLTWQGLPDTVISQLSVNSNQLAFFPPFPGLHAEAPDTGTMVANIVEAGTTGGSQPTWSATWGAVTNDGGNNGGVNWTCFGSPVQNWGIAPLAQETPSYSGTLPVVDPFEHSFKYLFCWIPNLEIGPDSSFAILDSLGNIQVCDVTGGTVLTGGSILPSWATSVGGTTQDGQLQWVCYGPIGPWFTGGSYGGGTSGVSNTCVIVDTNGALQITNKPLVAQVAGAEPPTWSTTFGGTTTDGAITWTNMGAGSVLWSGTIQYAMSFHSIDGSVSTAGPISLLANGGLGPSGGFWMTLQADLAGTAAVTDKQIDQIWLWRAPQGQEPLILLDTVPNPFLLGNSNLIYSDVSTDLDLDPEIPAPVADANDPPDPTMINLIYAFQRVWGIVGNTVVCSGGPETVTGNGNTSFAPLDEIPYPCQPIRLIPVTVQDGGILVLTTDGAWIILGSGTATDPFYTTIYYSTVSIRGYNAVDTYNNQVFMVEANSRVSALAIEYPFNPQGGYTEVGFPIGDQFQQVTTGGINAALYDPATAYLAWNVQSTNENAMYVADGAVGWFRMGLIMPPESGLAWSPRRAIVGGTSAVQSIETSPGKMQLLIGPASSGPILTRDDTGTVYSDNGTAYPAWDAKGVNILCSTGQWAEVAHISTKSAAVGARPIVSVLLNEIAPSTQRPYDVLNLDMKSNDPPLTKKSLSVYSDRYVLAQNGVNNTGDCMLTKFDYGTQDEPDELLDWGIFASIHDERSESAEKA